MKLEANTIVNSIGSNLRGLLGLADVVQTNLKDTEQSTRQEIAHGIGELLANDTSIVGKEISKLNLAPHQSLYLELALKNLVGFFKSILTSSAKTPNNEPVIANLS